MLGRESRSIASSVPQASIGRSKNLGNKRGRVFRGLRNGAHLDSLAGRKRQQDLRPHCVAAAGGSPRLGLTALRSRGRDHAEWECSPSRARLSGRPSAVRRPCARTSKKFGKCGRSRKPIGTTFVQTRVHVWTPSPSRRSSRRANGSRERMFLAGEPGQRGARAVAELPRSMLGHMAGGHESFAQGVGRDDQGVPEEVLRRL